MAWLTREDARSYSRLPKEPDMETLSYWLARLEPLIRAENEGEIIVVIANRCGVEDDAVYAGTSAVIGIDAGEVKVYGILGRGERELLVVDTSKPAQAKLISEPVSASSNESTESQVSNSTKRTTPERDEVIASIDQILSAVAPISPVEPMSPHSYFSSLPSKLEEQHSSLKSSISRTESPKDSPPLPIHERPASPKSRNASRTRQPTRAEPALICHDLADEPVIGPIIRQPSVPGHMKISPSSASDAVSHTWSKDGPVGTTGRRRSSSPRPRSAVF